MDKTMYATAGASTADATPSHGGSAASWGAILGGAAAAAALSLILLTLGTGLGMSAMSPWSHDGASSTTIGLGAILWLTLTSIIASGAGGYIAGRLRARWVGTHGDEVYFRDTVHGFLAWSVATLVTAAVLTSAIGSVLSAGARVGGAVASTAATAATTAGGAAAAASASNGGGSSNGYFIDTLFRKAAPDANASPATGGDGAGGNGQPPVGEVTRIFAEGLKSGTLSPEDTRYVGQVVAQRAGIPQADAEKRVTDAFARAQAAATDAANKAKEAADTARKTSAYASLWLFISLLMGAFAASFAATFGGRRRDLH